MAGYEIAAATMSAETSFMFFCVDVHRDGRRHDDAVYHSAHSCRQHAFCQRVGPAAAEQHLADDQAGQPDDYHARTQRIVSKFLILGDERA